MLGLVIYAGLDPRRHLVFVLCVISPNFGTITMSSMPLWRLQVRGYTSTVCWRKAWRFSFESGFRLFLKATCIKPGLLEQFMTAIALMGHFKPGPSYIG